MSRMLNEQSADNFSINELRIEVTFNGDEAAIHHQGMVFFNIPCNSDNAMKLALQESKKYQYASVKIFQGNVCRVHIKNRELLGTAPVWMYYPHSTTIPLKYHDLVIID